jgi:hypothetical protein
VDAENFILNTLKNDDAVKTYTESITAMIIPQDVHGSAITYFRVSSEPLNTLCGVGASEFVNMQVDFWGTQYREVVEMFKAGRDALVATGKAIITNRHDERDEASGYYRVIAEFRIFCGSSSEAI